MSKEKISVSEIVDMMIQNKNLTRKSTEDFVKVLLSIIEDALIEGEVVKVKGLGTFKPQWNEPRKSVDVNTGNEILIGGYNKVVFVPENDLRDLINQPFAHLESVELSNTPEISPIQAPQAEITDNEPMRMFEEQAAEIKNILSEIEALSDKKTEVKTVNEETESLAIEPEETNEVSPEVVDEKAERDDAVKDSPEMEEKEEMDEIEDIEETEEIKEIKEVKKYSAQLDVDDDSEIEKDMKKKKKKKNKKEWAERQKFDLSDFDEVREVGKSETNLTAKELEIPVAEIPTNSSSVLPESAKPETEKTPEIDNFELKSVTESNDVAPIVETEIKTENEPILVEDKIETETEVKTDEEPEIPTPYFGEEVQEEGAFVTNKSEINETSKSDLTDNAIRSPYMASEPIIYDSSRENADDYLGKERARRLAWLYWLIPILLLGVAVWLLYPRFISHDTVLKTGINQEQTNPVINPVEPAVIDTVASSLKNDSTLNVFDAPRVYTEFIATEKMKPGSQLSRFAKQYLGHAYFWVYIYEANKDQIKDPDHIPLGIDVKIPKLDPRLIDPKNPECLKKALILSTEYTK